MEKLKNAVINSFIYTHFNYCLFLVHTSLLEKLKTFIVSVELDGYNNDYEALIKKDGTFTMKIERLRVLATEILKTINYINPSYMKNIFISKANVKVHQNDIEVRYHKTTSYGDESLNILSPKKRNHHPSNIQFETFLTKFRNMLIHGLDLHVNVSLVE